VNDLIARDHLRREGVAADSPFRYDWVSQKSFDGALPFVRGFGRSTTSAISGISAF